MFSVIKKKPVTPCECQAIVICVRRKINVELFFKFMKMHHRCAAVI